MLWLLVVFGILVVGGYVASTLPRFRKARRLRARKRELTVRPPMAEWAARHGLVDVVRVEQRAHELARDILEQALSPELADILRVVWAPDGASPLVLVESHDPAGQKPITVTARRTTATGDAWLRVNTDGPPPDVASPHLAAAQAAVAGLPAGSWVQLTPEHLILQVPARLGESLADDLEARLARLSATLTA